MLRSQAYLQVAPSYVKPKPAKDCLPQLSTDRKDEAKMKDK